MSKVWVLTVTEMDSECYAEGPALVATVHKSKDGAVEALQSYLEQINDDLDVAKYVARASEDGWVAFDYDDERFECEVNLKQVKVEA